MFLLLDLTGLEYYGRSGNQVMEIAIALTCTNDAILDRKTLAAGYARGHQTVRSWISRWTVL